MTDLSGSEQIDDIIHLNTGWKAVILETIRGVVLATDSNIVEEVKWKMATRPEGLAVWSCNGIVCFAEVWKDNVKLLFSKGAQLKDTNGLFNARLKSKELRAIEFREDDAIDEAALKALVTEAIAFNISKSSRE